MNAKLLPALAPWITAVRQSMQTIQLFPDGFSGNGVGVALEVKVVVGNGWKMEGKEVKRGVRSQEKEERESWFSLGVWT